MYYEPKEQVSVPRMIIKLNKLKLAQKLRQLNSDGDHDNVILELTKFEHETFGEPTKSLAGKIDYSSHTDDNKSVELAKQMIEKLQHEKNEHKRILKQRRQKIKDQKEKRRAEQEKREQEENEEMERQFQAKKDRISKSIESRKNRIKDSKTMMVSETRRRVKKSPMHKKIVANFQDSFVMPELERRKKTLAHIRNFMTPIRINDIKQHSQHKKDLLKLKLKEYMNKRQFYIDCNNDTSDKYQSKFWQIVKNREKEQEEEEKAKKEEIRNRQKKKKDYGLNVRELYKPTISKKKRLEMELIRKNLEDPNSLSKARKGLMTTQNKHNKSMTVTVDQSVGDDMSSPKRKVKKPKPLDESRYTYTMVSLDKHQFVKHDYLTKERQKKEKDNDNDDDTTQSFVSKNKNKDGLLYELGKRYDSNILNFKLIWLL